VFFTVIFSPETTTTKDTMEPMNLQSTRWIVWNLLRFLYTYTRTRCFLIHAQSMMRPTPTDGYAFYAAPVKPLALVKCRGSRCLTRRARGLGLFDAMLPPVQPSLRSSFKPDYRLNTRRVSGNYKVESIIAGLMLIAAGGGTLLTRCFRFRTWLPCC
jgi:hypothetical protein